MKKIIFILSLILVGVFTITSSENKDFQKEEVKTTSVKSKILENKEVSQTLDKHLEANDQEMAIVKKSLKSQLSSNPEFDQKMESFKVFNRKVLLSKDEIYKKQELLQDGMLIRRNFLRLANYQELGRKFEDFDKMIESVDYFASALNWQENPNKKEVLYRVKSLFHMDLLSEAKTLEAKRATAANLMELFLVMKQHSPRDAQELKEQLRGTKVASIINFAEKSL